MSAVECSEETKCIYYIDEEETPYLVKLTVPPDDVTLSDFKLAINRPYSKFFFKSIDADFGVVKEEIFDDNATLPCYNGRVIGWLVTNEGSTISDSTPGPLLLGDSSDRSNAGGDPNNSANRALRPDQSTAQCGVTASASTQPPIVGLSAATCAPADSTSISQGQQHCADASGGGGGGGDTDSLHSSANQDCLAPLRTFNDYKTTGRHVTGSSQGGPPYSAGGHRTAAGVRNAGAYEAPSSMLSSDLETTSFFDSEDESSRMSSVTGTTWSSRPRCTRARQRKRRRRPTPMSRASSFSSITDSTLSLNIVAVTLSMDSKVNFLGISIVGQSNKAGDGGIYVGSIMKGGAVDQDGRIEPGDMILEVNGISFEQLTNDDAVRTLREQVQRPGPITLVVAKCWDPNPRTNQPPAPHAYFTVPRQEPVRPIDPRAWVIHTNAMTRGTGDQNVSTTEPANNNSTAAAKHLHSNTNPPLLLRQRHAMPPPTAMQHPSFLSSASTHQMAVFPPPHQLMQQQIPGAYPTNPQLAPSVVTSASLPEMERYSEAIPLTVGTDVTTVIRAMLHPESGLDIRDRTWLKLTVPSAFIGSDLVDWLYRHLDGFTNRKAARKYASNLLNLGYIRHTVNKTNFSEQCYYVFRDLASHVSTMSLEDELEPVDSVSEVGALRFQQQQQQIAWASAAASGGVISNQPRLVPPPYRAPPSLAAPIRQLIADGQDLAASQSADRRRQQQLNTNAAGATNVSRNNAADARSCSGSSSSSSSSSASTPTTASPTNQPSHHHHHNQMHHQPQQQSAPIHTGQSAPVPASASTSSTSSMVSDTSSRGGGRVNNARRQPPPSPPPRVSTAVAHH